MTAAPTHSKSFTGKLLATAIDPETAAANLIASTQEGGQRPIPANQPPPVKLLKWLRLCGGQGSVITPLVADTCEPDGSWPIGHRWKEEYQLAVQHTIAKLSIPKEKPKILGRCEINRLSIESGRPLD